MYLLQLIAAIAVSLGSLVVGYCTAYTSPALTTMIHENSTIAVTKQEVSQSLSLRNSIYNKYDKNATILEKSVTILFTG